MTISSKKREVTVRSPEELQGLYDAIFLEFKVVPNLNPADAVKVVQEAKALEAEVKKAVPNLHTLVYQDADLEYLVQHLSTEQKKELPAFLAGLANAGQITKSQQERFSEPIVPLKEESVELVLQWLPQCLEHLNAEGSLSWPVRDASVYFEDAGFFEAVLSSAELEMEQGKGVLVIKKLPALA